MRPLGRIESARRRRGTAITETVLIIPVLLFFVVLAPWVAHLFLDVLVTRTEAHRDTFEKTTTFVLMPEAMMDVDMNGQLSSRFGHLTAASRQHVLADFPPVVPDAISAILDPPGGPGVPVRGFSLDPMPHGLPNSFVEGWEYLPRANVSGAQAPLHLMAYGAVIRSPWTKLGWPWVAAQDVMWEPKQMQTWQEDQAGVTDEMVERYKLAE